MKAIVEHGKVRPLIDFGAWGDLAVNPAVSEYRRNIARVMCAYFAERERGFRFPCSEDAT